MLTVGNNIRVYNSADAEGKSFFTGGMNTQTLDFDPLVTGYAFIKWIKIPAWIRDMCPGFAAMTEKNFKSFEGIDDIELQVGEYEQSFNNNQYPFATTISKNNTDFTLKHQEFSGNPIKNMYQYWITGIRDPRTDIATYPALFGCEYAAKNHTGELIYIMTRPDVNNVDHHNIEFAAYYTNVFPTKIPLAHLNYTQGTHDSPEIDISFRGTMHLGPKIDEFAKGKLKECYAFNTEGMSDPEDSTFAFDNITGVDRNSASDTSGGNQSIPLYTGSSK